MSVPDPSTSRKPNRWGLYVPFALLAAAIAAWSAYWAWAKAQLVQGLASAPTALGQAGYPLSWTTQKVGGYPFRLDVTLTDVRAGAPGGWALTAPRLEAEAEAFAPTQWMVAAPDGLTFVRPLGGPVTVTGKLIHASLSHIAARPPSVSFEGVDLAFQPGPGAQPFSLTKAGRVEFHLRAGPNDEGGVFARIDAGQARLSGLFERVAGGKPIDFTWNSTLSKMSAFQGRDWPDAVRRWSAAGGRMTVRSATLTAGEALVNVASGDLGVARDGRLSGALALTLRQAPRSLGALADSGVVEPQAAQSAREVAEARQTAPGVAQAKVEFIAGHTIFGPVSLGPAPKVYDPR